MKKICAFVFNGMLLFSFVTCTIEKEVYSPGDFMDCSHEANIFSTKFNGDIVFTSYDEATLMMLGTLRPGFSARGTKGMESFSITASFDTLIPGSFACDYFTGIGVITGSGVAVIHELPGGDYKLYRADCSKHFWFDVEEIDFKMDILCVRVTFTAFEIDPIDHTVIEGGGIIVVEDGFLSFK